MSAFDSSQPVLVYLANGVQGGAAVRALLRRGLKVRALVRDSARFSALALPGVEIVSSDLHDEPSLKAASTGVAHAVVQIPSGAEADARAMAENAVRASRHAALTSVIFRLASASRPPPCEEPSFVMNAMVEDIFRCSGLSYSVVRPTMYLDNLLKPSARMEIMTQGVFSPPIDADQRIAWISADDCAEAVAMLLMRGISGGDYRIAGPESVTGDELAARISAGLRQRITAGLRQRITYRAQAVDAFEADVSGAMGSAARSVASKFRFFAARPDEADAILADPFRPHPGLDGFIPERIEAWVHRHQTEFRAHL